METSKLLARLRSYLTVAAGVPPPTVASAAVAAAPVDWQFQRAAASATLRLETKIGQFSFKWRFVLYAVRDAVQSRDLVREQLVLPLVDLAHAYEKRVAQLSAHLHRRESVLLAKVASGLLPSDLRKPLDDEQLERDVLEQLPELPPTLFKSDTFGERAFTQRLRKARDAQQLQRTLEREAKRVRVSQLPSASSDGSPAAASAAVSSLPSAEREPALPRKAPTSARPAAASAVAAVAPTAVPVAAAAAAAAPVLVRMDSIEETIEELERRRELEERLEREKKQKATSKTAVKKGFL